MKPYSKEWGFCVESMAELSVLDRQIGLLLAKRKSRSNTGETGAIATHFGANGGKSGA